MKGWMAAALVGLGALLAWAAMSLWPDRHAAPEPDVPSPAAAARADGDIAMDAALQKRLGVATSRLAAATAPSLASGYARALDLAPLAAINGDIAVARAAAAASAADAARLVALAAQDQSASTRAVQVARAQAAADAARTEQARRRVALEFGPGLAVLGDAARARLIADAANGQAALLRIDIPGAAPATGSRIRIDGAGNATVIGPAAAADARLQSAGVLAILRGPGARNTTAGRLLPATIASGGTTTGVIIPRESVLRWNGSLWVYRQSAPAQFQRRELVDARPVYNGWFATKGVMPGDAIVTTGAGAVLAAERSGDSSGEDE